MPLRLNWHQEKGRNIFLTVKLRSYFFKFWDLSSRVSEWVSQWTTECTKLSHLKITFMFIKVTLPSQLKICPFYYINSQIKSHINSIQAHVIKERGADQLLLAWRNGFHNVSIVLVWTLDQSYFCNLPNNLSLDKTKLWNLTRFIGFIHLFIPLNYRSIENIILFHKMWQTGLPSVVCIEYCWCRQKFQIKNLRLQFCHKL